MTTKPPRRSRKKRRVRRARYSIAHIATAASMAGGGASAGDIALALGRGATAVKVYALLSHYGIRLIPKTKAQVCFPLAQINSIACSFCVK